MTDRNAPDAAETISEGGVFGRMRAAHRVRLLPRESAKRLGQIVGLLYLLAGIAALSVGATVEDVAHPQGLVITGSLALVVGGVMLTAMWLWVDAFYPHFAVLVYVLVPAASVLITAGLYFAGPHYEIVALLYVEAPIFAFYLLVRRLALLTVGLVGAEYAAVLALQPGHINRPVHWLFVMGTLAAIAGTVGLFMERADRLAESEQRLRLELADINANLELRVAAQVDELERLNRLRRFLSPQVADAVLSSGPEALLEPHRRPIAAFFCDLRGFTRFTGACEPDDVVEVLAAYYEAVGRLLVELEATVGSFAGDGIMAYFGDPVPCADPAGRAVELGVRIRAPMAELIAAWTRTGFDLGYGVGVAFGEATLGMVGFEGRHDYTALGPVVNLAARLCAEATAGELLIDAHTFDATRESVDAEERFMQLKGFSDPVLAYRVQSWAPTAVERPRT